jgi:hypothetical protein
VPPTYVDLPALKESLGIPADDDSRDAALTRALNAASRGIDRDTGRRFWLDDAPVARTYKPQQRLMRDQDGDWLIVDDIGDEEGLLVESGTPGSWSPVANIETGPDNALQKGQPITALLQAYGAWGIWTPTARVRVTARWGWPTVPDEVVQATLIQAARLQRRKDSPEGVTGSAEWGVVRLPRTDPDVFALIKDLALPGLG